MPPHGRAMLPEPTLTFTIPSLHDGTTLNCRVFHPFSLSPSLRAPPWQRHAAVVAHPYAPLGGNWDDPIVDLVAATLLRAGFLVATFNFRGASGSTGRTSWTTKAERADYMSVAGFLCHYAHFVDPFRSTTSKPSTPIQGHKPLPAAITSSAAVTQNDRSFSPIPEAANPLFLHAGYSFGAMVTSQLPSLRAILEPFERPKAGTPAAEIRLRAQHLADVQNTVLGSARRAADAERRGAGGGASRESPRKSLGLRVGGDEDLSRKSHESHRSLRQSFDDAEDKLRKGVTELLAKTKSHRKQQRPGSSRSTPDKDRGDNLGTAAAAAEAATTDAKGDPTNTHHTTEKEGPEKEDHLPRLPVPPAPKAAYLLVSPPLGVAANLISLSFSLPTFPKRLSRKSSTADMTASSSSPAAAKHATAAADLGEAEQKLVDHPSMLVYGDNDVFVSSKKMRDWASKLQGRPGSLFRAHEVSTAGHFWVEGSAEGFVVDVLHHAVQTFSETLIREQQQ